MNQSTKHVLTNLQSAPKTPKMPVVFIGHGNPMNAINDSVFANEWRRMADRIPPPTAIICMSAHWLTRGLRVTALPQPATIHDFYGFPQELHEVQYPAPGNPELAKHTQSFLDHIELDHEWGFDHGAWSVLKNMYPNADIPTIQLSIDMEASMEELFSVVEQLKPLREHGVLFMGSGNIVHNLRLVDFSDNAPAQEWAEEFDAQSKILIEKRQFSELVRYDKLGSAARLSIPTEDHYRPMIMTLGLTDAGDNITFFNEDIDAGSVSMRSILFSPQ